MDYHFEIPYSFTDLNAYINAERSNKFLAAKIKRENTELAIWHFNGKKRIVGPVTIHFRWHEPTNRKDLDNIAFAKKFILDGMVKAGLLENDNPNHIKMFTDTFVLDKEWKGVKITVEEMFDG